MSGRVRRTTRRASYRDGVAWIAHEDNAGGEDSVDMICGYLTTHLLSDLFGSTPRLVAADVARVRRAAGLQVGPDDT